MKFNFPLVPLIDVLKDWQGQNGVQALYGMASVGTFVGIVIIVLGVLVLSASQKKSDYQPKGKYIDNDEYEAGVLLIKIGLAVTASFSTIGAYVVLFVATAFIPALLCFFAWMCVKAVRVWFTHRRNMNCYDD